MLHPLDGTPRRPAAGPGLVAAVEPGCDEVGNPCPTDPDADVPGCRRTISGRAFDGTTGAPLLRGYVHAMGTDEVAHRSPILDDGFFAFDMLPPGPVQLTILNVGYHNLRSTIEPSPGELRLTAVLARDESCDCMPLPLSGRVIGPDGTPVELAWVEATDTSGVMTRADGSFELHPGAREPVTIWAHKDGFVQSEITVNPEDDPVDAIEIRLERGTVVKGRLLGLRRGELAYIRAEREGPSIAGAKADRHTHAIPDLGPGIWTIYADLSDARHSTRMFTHTIEVFPGVPEIELDLDFTNAEEEVEP